MPYIDDALFVSEQQVPEDAGFIHVSQFDHVVHTLHWCRVHDLKGGFLLRGQTLLLEGDQRKELNYHVLDGEDDRSSFCSVSKPYGVFTFPSSFTSNRWPDGVTLSLAPMGTPISESTHTHSPWKKKNTVS